MSKIWTTISDAVIVSGKAVLATTGIQLRDNTEWLKARVDAIPSTAWSGLKLTAGIDTDHDVTVAAGAARDTTDADALVNPASQTKQLDVPWATGSNAGGLANAPLVSNSVAISFDNATSKINGTGLFGAANAGATVIVRGSASNDSNFEVTAATADSLTVSPAPTTEGAGSSITIYIIQPNWLYNLYIADDGAGGAEIGFDDDLAAANFLGLAGVGTLYRAIGYIETDASANVSNIVWIGDGERVRHYGTAGSYTWRKPALLHYLLSEPVGGGGGGGSDGAADGRNGASGGYSFKRILAADLAATETITVGTGGNPATTGQTGGTSSFGSHNSATGGTGGRYGDATVSFNSPGGVGSGGDYNGVGQTGGLRTGMKTAGMYGAGAGGAHSDSGDPGLVRITEVFA